MIFNLKKVQQIVPINRNESLDWQMAVGEVLAVAKKANGEPYMNIEEYMMETGANPQNIMEMAKGTTSEGLDEAQETVEKLEQTQQQIQNMVPGIMMGKTNKKFNLKKAQQLQQPQPFQYQEQPVSVPQEQMEIKQEQQDITQNLGKEKTFGTHSDLKDFLVHYSMADDPFISVWPIIKSENPKYPDDAQSGVKNFYVELELKSDEQLLDEANTIYNFIYGKEEDELTMTLPYGSPENIANITNDEIIKKIAEKIKKKKFNKKFNLKTAQHKTLENTIMWGPGQTRLDPFLRQPVSDWHIIERNKGFGLVVDDVWNIDYETIWRENIMDKYSRPYKNKEGSWVGGYLNKRFETDRNIPETTNMQLKPGELRKPILPEYGNLESRLQAARASGEIEGAYNISKPFNWKEAQSSKKKMKKEANILHSICNNITDKLSEQDIQKYIQGDKEIVKEIIKNCDIDSYSKKLITDHIDFLIHHDTVFLKASRENNKKKS